MSRLPNPGSDNGVWGDILNDYLSQIHNSDGTLKNHVVTAASIAPNTIDDTVIADGSITEVLLHTDVQTKLNAIGSPDWNDLTNKPAVIAAGATQANARTAIGAGTASTKSDVGLGNVDNTSDATKNSASATLTNKTIDLASNTVTGTTAEFNTALSDGNFATQAGTETLTNKTISGASNTLTNIAQSSVTNLTTDLAGKESSITAGTTGQYWRGDKTWQSLDKTAVGLSNANNTSDLNKPISTATQTALDAKADLVGGVIPTSQLPTLALTDVLTVASEAAMLALTSGQVQPGDVAVRTDGAGSFILTDTDPSVLANWTLLDAPQDAVTSVNGQQGTVVLGAGDIGLGNVDNTSDINKPISTATQTALDAKADLVGGLIPTSQMPSLSLTTAVTVANQAAMLALTTGDVQPGDLAIRTDGAGTFILTAADPSVLGNWKLLNAPTDAVTSVNGQTGTVSLTKSDVGLGNVDNTSDATKNSATATLTNKTLDNTNTVTLKDTNFTLQDDGDTTKQAKFQLSGISAGITRTLTMPNASTTLVGTDAAQTLTNKTIENMSAGSTPITSVANPSNQQDAATKDYVDTIGGLQSVTTAAGTTTLTVSSPMMTIFTGSTTQTCVLPDATTLSVGRKFVISNRSTNSVQVNMNGGSALQTMISTSEATLTLTNNSTAAGTWDTVYMTTGGDTGTVAKASVSTGEATTSTSYTDLTTTTDQVTVTVGSSGMALVTIVASDTASQGAGVVSYAVSGANTSAASDAKSGRSQWWIVASTTIPISFTFLETGLTPGSTTFKLKYKTSDGSSHSFSSRSISVIPLNNTNVWAGPTNSLQGNYASRPSASAVAVGSMFFCTDSDATYVSTGSAWTKIRAGGFNTPDLADPPTFTGTTQSFGTVNVAADADGRLITAPTQTNYYIFGEHLSLSPSSNYTATALLDANLTTGNITSVGIYLRESSSGKLVILGCTHINATGWFIECAKHSSATAYNSRYGTYSFTVLNTGGSNTFTGWPKWLRFRDDGTYRYFEASVNGLDWFSATSTTNISRTDYITPDQIGWFVQNSVSSHTLKARLRSFKVA